MKCSFLPVGSKSINDSLLFEEPMSWMMKGARKEKSIFSQRITGPCEHCGASGRLENHHIIPVWVFALNKCIDANLTNFEEWRRFLMETARGEVTITECNNPSNLIRLCVDCHDREDTKTMNEWKQKLKASYPNLFFGIKTGAAKQAWLKENNA